MKVQSETDGCLMEMVKRGDAAQLAVLFERHHAPLYRYLLHLTGDRAFSEDLVQEVFLRVLKYARTYDPRQPFTVWIYRMARNVHRDAARKRGPEAPNGSVDDFRSSEPIPEEWLTKKQDLAFLESALGKLPEDKRDVLVLSRYQNMRYEEIAGVLDCEVGAVKVRVFRALRQLREIFCELRGERIA